MTIAADPWRSRVIVWVKFHGSWHALERAYIDPDSTNVAAHCLRLGRAAAVELATSDEMGRRTQDGRAVRICPGCLDALATAERSDR